MTVADWQDLADSELRQRLERRGVPAEWAADAARTREHPAVARKIDELLGRSR